MADNQNRYNLPMSSVNEKGLEYLTETLKKNTNSKFVVGIARVNPKGTIYIGTSQSGKLFVSVPVVGDYADKTAKYAGLSEDEDGAGLFYTLMLGGKLAERVAKLVRNGSIRAGSEFLYTGTTSIRVNNASGRQFKNSQVSCSTFDVSRWGKKDAAAIAVRDNVGNAAPVPKAAQAPAAQPSYAAPTSLDLMSVDDEGDLPF